MSSRRAPKPRKPINAASVLRRLGHRLNRTEGSSTFKQYLEQKPSFSRALRRIVRSGCEEEAVFEFLFSECYERPLDTPSKRSGLRKIFKDAENLSAELKLISNRVREMNQFILSGLDREENFFLVQSKEDTVKVPVPVQHF